MSRPPQIGGRCGFAGSRQRRRLIAPDWLIALCVGVVLCGGPDYVPAVLARLLRFLLDRSAVANGHPGLWGALRWLHAKHETRGRTLRDITLAPNGWRVRCG